MTNASSDKRDFRYWRDGALTVLAVLCVGGSIGHFIDWIDTRRTVDLEVAIGFLAGFGTLLLLSSQRLEFLIITLLSMVAIGTVNAIARQTLLGLPIILPCAFFAYILLRYWARRGRKTPEIDPPRNR